jgi:hypothetical protein
MCAVSLQVASPRSRPAVGRRSRRRPKARRSGRRLAVVSGVLGVVISAVTLTGILVAAIYAMHPAAFPAPLNIYPVTQELPAACTPGTAGLTVSGSGGQVCYEVANGLQVRRVANLQVRRKGKGYEIAMSLSSVDGRAFARLTREYTGHEFLMVVKNQVVAAPKVTRPISGGRILITGGLTRSKADQIVDRLKG